MNRLRLSHADQKRKANTKDVSTVNVITHLNRNSPRGSMPSVMGADSSFIEDVKYWLLGLDKTCAFGSQRDIAVPRLIYK